MLETALSGGLAGGQFRNGRDLEKAITEEPKHAGVSKAMTPDRVKMIVSYIRSVQK